MLNIVASFCCKDNWAIGMIMPLSLKRVLTGLRLLVPKMAGLLLIVTFRY